MKRIPFIIYGFIFALSSLLAQEMDVDAIIDNYERNMVLEQSSMDAEMAIKDRFGTRRVSMKIYSRGRDDFLLEFTSSAEEGQKILRTADAIYLYYPDAANLIRLQGAALRKSMMGSDVSYEDVTGGRNIKRDYTITMLGTEVVEDVPCYKIELKAKKRNTAYPKQVIWINKENFSMAQVHSFALSGKLLKTILATQTSKIEDKYIITAMIIQDALKKKSSTTLRIKDVDITTNIDPSKFSLEELSW